MPDSRVAKLAKVLVRYSLDVQPNQKLMVVASPLAQELTLAIYEEAVKAGAHTTVMQTLEEAQELFFQYASDVQLDHVSPVDQLVTETYDAMLHLSAPANRRNLSAVDPQRMARHSRARAGLSKIHMERAARGELRWCVTVFPNNANAQDAGMSLRDYADFVYGAGMLDEADPVAYWRREGEHQRRLTRWLKGRDRVVLKGANIDLTLSIRDRTFKEADGRYNFPDGEIFTGPVEDSASGWVRFRYPAIYMGQEITDIELWFEAGRVVREKAGQNQALLTAVLDTDRGARYLGELGIGTNYGIQRFTKSMLFDEKIGGTIHFAVGASYPETGGRNESGIHWDMLCDMADSEISVDGEAFYRNGRTAIE